LFFEIYRIRNKRAYFIAACEEDRREAMSVALEGFRGFLYCFENVVEAGYILATGVGPVGAVKELPVMDEAYRTGKNII